MNAEGIQVSINRRGAHSSLALCLSCQLADILLASASSRTEARGLSLANRPHPTPAAEDTIVRLASMPKIMFGDRARREVAFRQSLLA
jgi:hypothetical protein